MGILGGLFVSVVNAAVEDNFSAAGGDNFSVADEIVFPLKAKRSKPKFKI